MNTNIRKVQDLSIEGDIYEHYSNLVGKVISSGDSDPKFLSYDSSEPPCPIGPNQFTRVKLTDGSCDLTCFNDSFIKMKINTTLNFSSELVKKTASVNKKTETYSFRNGEMKSGVNVVKDFMKDVPILYVGFKSGIHAIDHYRVYNEKGRGYIAEQSQAIYESVLNYFAKSDEEIGRRPGCYATESKILENCPNLPGRYITYGEFVECIGNGNSGTMDISFEVIVPFDDFACFQFFDIYPNNICGNLQLELKLNSNKNFVIYPIPLDLGFKKAYNKDSTLYKDISQAENFDAYPEGLGFTSELDTGFYPTGEKFKMNITAYDKAAKGEVVLTEEYVLYSRIYNMSITTGNFILTECKSFINGYNSSQSKMNDIKQLLSSNKIYIPAQRIDQYTFSQRPSSNMINCNTTQSLINCSSMIFLFPKSNNYLSCSKNPMLDSLQVQIDNKSYPDKPFSTYSLQHSNYVLSNLMFNSYFKPNSGLYHAVNESILNEHAGREKDKTNYMFVISTERKDSDPYVFEGITKNNVFITLNATYSNKSFYTESKNDLACPIMLLNQDTLWELSSEGTNYYYNDRSIVPKLTGN